jgi:AAA domain
MTRMAQGAAVPDTADGAGPIAARQLVLTPATQIAPAPVVWAWTEAGTGRIPAGALVVAAGREGTGKSSFGIWLAAQVTQGQLPGAWSGQPSGVIYVAIEDSWRHTLVPRLIAAGADLDRVYRAEVAVHDHPQTTTLCLPADNALLEDAIGEHQVALVVLDPLLSLIGAGIDTHRERDTRTALDPLARLADRTGAVVLGIAHFSKAAGTDASTLITGSTAFRNVARAIFGFARDDDGAHVLSQTKNSLGRSDLPSFAYTIEPATIATPTGPTEVGRFAMLGPSHRHVADILARSGLDDPDERRDAAAWLRSFLADNGGQAEAIDVLKAGDKVGFSKDTLKRVKTRAGVTSRKDGMDAGWMWVLDPNNHHPPSPQRADPGSADPAEGSTKGAKGAASATPHPSLPSRSLPGTEHTDRHT